MLFGEGYDMSLYLILKSDKKNRNLIFNFLRDFPMQLYLEILDCLNRRKNDTDEDWIEENECYSYDNLFHYSYQISSIGYITLSSEIFSDNRYRSLYDLELCDIENLDDYENFDSETIGSFSITKSHQYIDEIIKSKDGTSCLNTLLEQINSEYISLEKCKERSYNLLKTPLGWLIEYNLFDSDYELLSQIPVMKSVNMQKCKRFVKNDIAKYLELNNND